MVCLPLEGALFIEKVGTGMGCLPGEREWGQGGAKRRGFRFVSRRALNCTPRVKEQRMLFCEWVRG